MTQVNPTEQFREAVESVIHRLLPCMCQFEQGFTWKKDSPCVCGVEEPRAEALASIQASTVELLEGLKDKAEQFNDYNPEYLSDDPVDVVRVDTIDQLIKDLSNGHK